MEDLLNQICRIYKTPSSPDRYGKITWGAFDSMTCRFVKTAKHYKNAQGNEISINSKFQIADRSVEVNSKIEFETNFYKVVDVKEWRDINGELFGCMCYCSDFPTS